MKAFIFPGILAFSALVVPAAAQEIMTVPIDTVPITTFSLETVPLETMPLDTVTFDSAPIADTSVYSDTPSAMAGTIEYGVLAPTMIEPIGVPLAPGEKVIKVLAVPSVIQMPAEETILYKTLPYAPPSEIDRVTGLLRNTTGWTGDAAGPAGIGCFPQGVCTHLNR